MTASYQVRGSVAVITLDNGVDFVLQSLGVMIGGEIFVPKLPSVKIADIIATIGTDVRHKIVGIRPGEKLHEVMIPLEEARNAIDMGSFVAEAQRTLRIGLAEDPDNLDPTTAGSYVGRIVLATKAPARKVTTALWPDLRCVMLEIRLPILASTSIVKAMPPTRTMSPPC